MLGVAAVDGIVFDLGVSSFQLDEPGAASPSRPTVPWTCAWRRAGRRRQISSTVSTRASLPDMFATLGEEPQARAVARAIGRARRATPIVTTGALAAVIGSRQRRAAGSTRPGDALLPGAADGGQRRARRARPRPARSRGPAAPWRPPGRGLLPLRRGRSGEAVRQRPWRPRGPALAPSAAGRAAAEALALAASGVDKPGAAELAANPRARSARLRAAERLEAGRRPTRREADGCAPREPPLHPDGRRALRRVPPPRPSS